MEKAKQPHDNCRAPFSKSARSAIIGTGAVSFLHFAKVSFASQNLALQNSPNAAQRLQQFVAGKGRIVGFH